MARKFRPRLGGVGPRLTARCEASTMAQACPFPTLCSFRSGQSHSFRALSICRGSWLGNFDPGSAELAHGSRLGVRPRPWLKPARFLPFAHSAPGNHILLGPLAYATAHGSENFTPARRSWPTAHGSCLTARCEAPTMAQGCLFPSLCSSRSGQSHSFWSLSISHVSWLGGPNAGSGRGSGHDISLFSKVAIYLAKYRTLTPFFAT